MFKGNWRNRFGSGLLVGILGVTILAIWGEYLYEFVKCVADSECEGYAARHKDGNEPEWWYWARRLVSTEDTLAQWFMMLFTVAAAGLLWWTLVETRKIGKAQTRAYLHVEKAEVIWLNSLGHFENTERGDVFAVVLNVRNTGTTPAKWHEISGRITVRKRSESGSIDLNSSIVKPMRWGHIAPGEASNSRFGSHESLPLFHDATESENHMLMASGLLTYETVFGEICDVPFAFFIDCYKIQNYFMLLDFGDMKQARETITKMNRPTYGSYDQG